MEARNNSDEIDLVDLFLKVVIVVRKNFFLILLFFVVGTAIGSLYYYSSKKIYENNLLIRSSILAEASSEKIIDNINAYLREGNITGLSSLLDIKPELAGNINSVEIENVVNEKATPSEEKNGSIFIITIRVYTQDQLPEFQSAFINFIENNEFVKVRVEQNKKNLTQLLKKVDVEIASLEDFKTRVYQGNFFKDVNGNFSFDPTTVNSKILDLTNQRLEYQNQLDLVESVQVIQGFVPFEKPVSPRLSLSIAAGAFFGLVMVGVFIVFKSLRKLLQVAEANQKSA
jgi:hypothetical protein